LINMNQCNRQVDEGMSPPAQTAERMAKRNILGGISALAHRCMGDNVCTHRPADAPQIRDHPCRLRWRSHVILVVLSMICGLCIGVTGAGERAKPILIGGVTDSWGPTPQMGGLRDGLLAMGYREDEHFVLGVRFTQGDRAALPSAARELVEHGVDLIVASDENPAKAAQLATNRIPIVFAGGWILWARD
jgi:ABC transporter substrate binding protein